MLYAFLKLFLIVIWEETSFLCHKQGFTIDKTFVLSKDLFLKKSGIYFALFLHNLQRKKLFLEDFVLHLIELINIFQSYEPQQ